jgi:predicted transcriptional regulator
MKDNAGIWERQTGQADITGRGSPGSCPPSSNLKSVNLNTFSTSDTSVETRLAFLELIREAIRQGIPPRFLERELGISFSYATRMMKGHFPSKKLVARIGLDRIMQVIDRWHELEIKVLELISTKRLWTAKRLLRVFGNGMNQNLLVSLVNCLERKGWVERDEREPRFFWITKQGERELRLRR